LVLSQMIRLSHIRELVDAMELFKMVNLSSIKELSEFKELQIIG
jgi:hypothetical protein